MRAVVDTNVLVSAQLKPGGAPSQVLDHFREGRFTLVMSEPLLAEVAAVLARPRITRKYPLTAEDVARYVSFLRDGAHWVSLGSFPNLCRDPKDDMVIETALRGSAEVLVSRDEDLTRASELVGYLAQAGVRVLTVRQFLLELAASESG